MDERESDIERKTEREREGGRETGTNRGRDRVSSVGGHGWFSLGPLPVGQQTEGQGKRERG